MANDNQGKWLLTAVLRGMELSERFRTERAAESRRKQLMKLADYVCSTIQLKPIEY
jgi:hypothetical protein